MAEAGREGESAAPAPVRERRTLRPSEARNNKKRQVNFIPIAIKGFFLHLKTTVGERGCQHFLGLLCQFGGFRRPFLCPGAGPLRWRPGTPPPLSSGGERPAELAPLRPGRLCAPRRAPDGAGHQGGPCSVGVGWGPRLRRHWPRAPDWRVYVTGLAHPLGNVFSLPHS